MACSAFAGKQAVSQRKVRSTPKSGLWFITALVVTAVAGTVLIGYEVLRGRTDGMPHVAEVSPGDALVPRHVGVAVGHEDAPLVLEHYTDYLCPYCAVVERLTMPQIVDRYVNTGQVLLILFDFPIHGEAAQLGAEAARCARDQDRYWGMRRILFDRMREWGAKQDPRSLFHRYAESLELDGRTFRDCIDRRRHEEIVRANRKRGLQLGVDGTPTFLINERRISGAIGFDRLASLIEREMIEP